MAIGRENRLAPLAGVLFGALALAGLLVAGSEPEFVDEPAAIARYYEDDEGTILLSKVLYLLATASLLWFMGALHGALRRAEQAEGRLAATALAGGTAVAALLAAAAATGAVGALRVMEHDQIDPQVATIMWDLSAILFGLAAPLASAVLVLATAILSHRTHVFPRWHVIVSVVLAVSLIIPPLAGFAFLGFVLWVGVTGGLVYRQTPVAHASPG